jgi:glycosyltransferase involved in cell wall biosynthesis
LAPSTGKRPFHIAHPAADHRPAPLDADAIRARALAPGPLRLLFVGALIPRKGLPGLLAAVSRLPCSDWRLDVVGDTAVSPAATQRIRRQIRLSGLENNVTLHGRLDDPALNALLRQSHLLAVPSRYEGFGVVYLEGMGAGLPAIAGRGGAAHEIVRHGENGFLLSPDAPETIAYHLQALHQNRERLAEMALAAFRRYRAHPTWAETMGGVRAFLRGMESMND